jgi:hypothetical protein
LTSSETDPVAKAQEMLDVLMALKKSDEVLSGFKEFFLVFSFKGTNFWEQRYVVSRKDVYDESRELTSGLVRTVSTYYAFDLHKPNAYYLARSVEGVIGNGDTISSRFDFVLDDAGVRDGGKARVTEIKLVIASEPDSGQIMADGSMWYPGTWNYLNWTQDSLYNRFPISLQDLYNSRRVTILDYPIDVPMRQILNVGWRDIDPLAWPSGRYFIGVVASDEYGNEGLAPVTFDQADRHTNPLLVTVLSGK